MFIRTQSLHDFMVTLELIKVRRELTQRTLSSTDKDLTAWLRQNRGSLSFSDYAADIILLYGALEQYLESLVMEYLSVLSTVSSRRLLPPSIIESHFKQSIDYIRAVDSDSRLSARNTSDRVQILNSILTWESNTSSSTILGGAFIPHSTFNIEQIREFLKRVGIELELIKLQAPVIGLLDQPLASLHLSQIFPEINLLAGCRNLVAHGNIQSVQSPEILDSWRNAVSTFCCAVDSLAIQTCHYHGSNTKPPINLIDINSKVAPKPVLCFTLPPHQKISQGDLLLICGGNRAIDIGMIVSLQVDRQAYPAIIDTSPVNVGAQVETNHSPPQKLNPIRLIDNSGEFWRKELSFEPNRSQQ